MRRCLAKSRDERYASAGELLLDLVACRARVAARASGWRAALRQPRYVVPAAPGGASPRRARWPGPGQRGAPARWARDVALAGDRPARRQRTTTTRPTGWRGRRSRYLPGNPQLDALLEGPLLRHVAAHEPARRGRLHEVLPHAGRGVEARRAHAARGLPDALRDAPLAHHQGGIRAGGGDLRTGRAGSRDRCNTRSTRRASVPAGMVRVAGRTLPRSATILPSSSTTSGSTGTRSRTGPTRSSWTRAAIGKRDYWKQPFVKDGRTLSWEEAMALLPRRHRPARARDLGARNLPRRPGRIPGGRRELVRSGRVRRVRGQGAADLLSLVQGDGHRPEPPASPTSSTSATSADEGRSPSGASAGRHPSAATTWRATSGSGAPPSSGARAVHPGRRAGTSRPTPTSTRTQAVARGRGSPINGFRCARYMAPLPAALPAPVEWAWRNYSAEKPASDEAFRSYRSFYSYDRTDLEGRGRGGGGGGALAAREGLVRRRLRPRARAGAPLPSPQREAALPDDRVLPDRRGAAAKRRATTSGWRTSTSSSAADAPSCTPSTRAPTSAACEGAPSGPNE